MLGLIGAGIRWTWSQVRVSDSSRSAKLDKWHAELQAREAKLDTETETRVATLERAVLSLQDEVREREQEHSTCQHRVDKLLFFCVMLVEESETLNPQSTTIQRAKTFLRREFPEAYGPQPPVPADMQRLLEKINEGEKT